MDSEGYHRTEAPMLIYQMITQHIDVARTVSPALVALVLKLAMEQMDKFLTSYIQLVTEYKTQNFEDRARFRCYTAYMIAVANNAVNMEDLLIKLNEGKKLDLNLAQKLKTLKENALEYLCMEVLMDIKAVTPNIMTKKWLTKEDQTIDTVIVTLADYGNDYTALIDYEKLIKNIEKQVASNYMRAICDRKLSFKNYEERKIAAELIVEDTNKLEKQFRELYKKRAATVNDSELMLLKLMAEVLKMKDSSLLSLEISGLVKRFPEVSVEDLLALLELRGDISRVEARQLISDLKPGSASERTIFANLLPNL